MSVATGSQAQPWAPNAHVWPTESGEWSVVTIGAHEQCSGPGIHRGEDFQSLVAGAPMPMRLSYDGSPATPISSWPASSSGMFSLDPLVLRRSIDSSDRRIHDVGKGVAVEREPRLGVACQLIGVLLWSFPSCAEAPLATEGTPCGSNMSTVHYRLKRYVRMTAPSVGQRVFYEAYAPA